MNVYLFLNGTIFATAFIAMLFFYDFWRKTRDSLFLFFALAFSLFSVERLLLAFMANGSEYKVYLIRLLAFILIIIAIVQKNRGKR